MKRKTAKIISIILAVITAISICGGALAAVANATNFENVFEANVVSALPGEEIQAAAPDNNTVESFNTFEELPNIPTTTTDSTLEDETHNIPEVKSVIPYIEETTTEPVTGEKTIYSSGEPKAIDTREDSPKETMIIVDIQYDVGKISATFKGKNNKQTVELEYCKDYDGSPCYMSTAAFPADKYNITLKPDNKRYKIDMNETIIDFDGKGDVIKIEVNYIKDTDAGVAGFFKNNTFIILALIASTAFYFVYKRKNSFKSKNSQ